MIYSIASIFEKIFNGDPEALVDLIMGALVIGGVILLVKKGGKNKNRKKSNSENLIDDLD